MESKKKSALGAVITGTLISGSILSVGAVNANTMFDFDDLGSGAELRSDLLDASNTGFKIGEAKCGEGKCGEEKKAESSTSTDAAVDSKSAEHKCGEGKCGEHKEEAQTSTDAKASEETKDESKSTEHKCGEGKCDGTE